MTFASDRPLTHRIWMGFALVLLVLLAAFVAVRREHAQSTAATTRLESQVLPRTMLAWALERQLLLVGIEVRSLLLVPESTPRRGLSQRIEEARRALDDLSTMPKDPDGAELFVAIQPAVLRYVTMVDSIASARPTFTADVERALSAQRTLTLGLVQRYAELQQRKADTTMMAVSAARARVTRAMAWALVLSLAGAALAGGLTARSVRASTEHLMRVARQFEAGDWRAVLRGGRPTSSEAAVAPRNELARVARAFEAAGGAIEQRERELRARAEVTVGAASSLDVRDVARAVLPVVADHAGAAVGVIHLAPASVVPTNGTAASVHGLHSPHGDTPHGDAPDGDAPDGAAPDGAAAGLWDVVATVGLASFTPLRAHDGVPGRAIQEGRLQQLTEVPADTPFRVRVGFDEAPVRSIVSVPLRTGSGSVAVLTLGALRAFTPESLEFLQAVSTQIGIGLQNARTHGDVQRLLAAVSQQRARLEEQHLQLQAQTEELQAQFEEIQAQSEEIQAQNEELQAQSDEIQTQNARLLEQTAALSSADRQKDRFVALLAHELRNPLATITNGVHLLALSSDPMTEHQSIEECRAQVQRAQQMIARQTTQLTRLVDDLLDVTQVAQGKVLLERQAVDFGALVARCVADLRLRLDKRRLSLELVVPETPLYVLADASRLAQMVDNIIDNAIKFTPPDGSIVVSLDATPEAARLTVRDTGIGIDASLLPRLFEPFTQGGAGGPNGRAGLGLGLSLVHAYTALHGGDVTVASDGAGHGTTVTLALPLASAAPATEPLPAPHRLQAAVARRILVVEDDTDAAMSLGEVLRQEGHTVCICHSARDGLDQGPRFRPDLILCDIAMPDMDGFGFAQAARQEPALATVWLVALTGFAGEEHRQRAFDAGFDEHVTKPASVEVLRALTTRHPRASRDGATIRPT